jgi:hypothetical protein
MARFVAVFEIHVQVICRVLRLISGVIGAPDGKTPLAPDGKMGVLAGFAVGRLQFAPAMRPTTSRAIQCITRPACNRIYARKDEAPQWNRQP